mmetsp:Transcript_2288/g.7278  ORF Transcript_2288/g.7278 Transcript_2288/m.7278 type:complete len:89 (-) Transcript_2288:2014-2280(-)
MPVVVMMVCVASYACWTFPVATLKCRDTYMLSECPCQRERILVVEDTSCENVTSALYLDDVASPQVSPDTRARARRRQYPRFVLFHRC